MRVLHLTAEFPPFIWGGLGTAVGGLATASARAGLDVKVLLVAGSAISLLRSCQVPSVISASVAVVFL
jgi:hypothetical protein